jgi:hypothetical protein
MLKTVTSRSINGTPPKRRYGRNRPHVVEVLSTRPPYEIGDATQMRTTRKRVPAVAALMPATSV